jgi:hypothetical protein
MGIATGTSVKGFQGLLYDAEGLNSAAVRLIGGFPSGPKKQGFISVQVYNGANFFQIAGQSLWYEGVIWFTLPTAGLPLYLVASWEYAGLDWEAVTF